MRTFITSAVPRFPAAIVMQGVEPMRRPPACDAGPHGVARTFTKGEELFAEGDETAAFYQVVSGTIRTCRLLSDGRRQIDAFHLPGDIFGLENGEVHRFSAEAVDKAGVVAFRRDSLRQPAALDTALGSRVVAAMLQNLERAQDHMVLLGRKTAQEKIATFLVDMARRIGRGDSFALPMPRSDIADHLGLTIETVSRTLSEFARKNYIALVANSRSVTLRNTQALVALNA
jgi:CRP/FNR family nitrogen fixation transcriptional regulator